GNHESAAGVESHAGQDHRNGDARSEGSRVLLARAACRQGTAGRRSSETRGMKYFGLIWAGLWRKRARTLFTMASIVVAFLLFGLLQGLNQGVNTVATKLNVDRLYVSAKTNMTDGLPLNYGAAI